MIMENCDESVEINHNPNWPYPSSSLRILINGGSGSDKTNVLLKLIKYEQPDTEKIHLNESTNYLSTGEKLGIKKLKNPKASIDYSQTIMFYF